MNTKKILIILGIILVLITTCCACTLFLGPKTFNEIYKKIPLDIEYTLPDEINEGDEFDWEVVITNTTDKPVEIHEFEVGTNLLDAMNIKINKPIITNEDTIELLGGYLTYTFDPVTIEPGDEFEIEISSTARKEGVYFTNITIYTTRLFNQTEDLLTITIDE